MRSSARTAATKSSRGGARSIAGVETLLLVRVDQDLELERAAGGAVAHLGALELVARCGEQRERAPQDRDVAPAAVAHRQRPAAVENVRPHATGKRRDQPAL